MTDTLERFLFENRQIRGEIVTLESSFNSIIKNKDYPEIVQKLLGELVAAASLLTATLKFKGEISLQIQSEGFVRYAVVNGTHELDVKGVAKWDETLDSPPSNFKHCFKKGILAITLTPENGTRYQGMVSLDQDSLADCLENYFLQSEQLLTTVVLATDLSNTPKAGGFLVQVIPTSSEATNVANTPDYEHVSYLTRTITSDELFAISHKEMIHRLFHEDDIRIFEPQMVNFKCDCSRERCAGALRNVNKSELLSMVAEEGSIKMDCQFCHSVYDFDAIDIENIHAQNLDSGSA